jgi:uncharacterized damage-inducible protein DinB
MSQREQILSMFQLLASSSKLLIDDVTEEESMVRSEHRFNHIRWQTGHLVHSNYQILRLLDESRAAHPGLKEIFDYRTELSDDPNFYPTMAELRRLMKEVEKDIEEAAKEAPDAAFDREVVWGEGKIPVSHMIGFLCMHNFYHCGQITHIRKMLGRPRPFV